MTETKTKALAPIEAMRVSLEKMSPQFKLALPSNVTPEKFVRVAMTAMQENDKLLTTDRTSLFASFTKCAQDGLLPDGKEAAIIPFGKSAVYMPMVAGILKKIRNSGEISSIAPHVVYENDKFEYWIDEKGEHIKHVPQLSGERGDPTHAYCIATTKDQSTYIEVMDFEQIEKVRKSSRNPDKGPWKDWWSEMARKTVLRRLSKRLPMSSDAQETVHQDDQLYDLEKPKLTEPREPMKRLKDTIEQDKKEENEKESVADLVGEDEMPI